MKVKSELANGKNQNKYPQPESNKKEEEKNKRKITRKERVPVSFDSFSDFSDFFKLIYLRTEHAPLGTHPLDFFFYYLWCLY